MKRPLTGLVIVFATGIWAGSVLEVSLGDATILLAVLLLLFLLLRHTRLAVVALLAAMALAGLVSYRQSTTPTARDITRLLPVRDQNVALRGQVVSAPTEAGRFRLRIAELRKVSDWQRAEGVVMAQVAGSRTNTVALRYGDEIECSVVLRVPPAPDNPGGFDQRAWLARQQITFLAIIRSPEDCRVLARDRGNAVVALSLRIREHFEAALRHGIETEPGVVGVLTGMVIGQRSEIPPDTYADFQRTGVMHVFAVSGLHVGLIAAVMTGTLLLLQVPRRWCGLVGIPLLVLYVFATGARPSAVRALVMVSVFLGGWAFVRPVDGLNSLAAAALGILLFDPAQLFDGGFQLSVGAVAALMLLAGGTNERLRGWLAPDPFIPLRLVPWWRRALADGWKQVAKFLACSWAAWIGLLPMMAWYFNLFTPIGVLTNLVVVPLLGIIIGLGLLSTAAFTFWPWLALTFNNTNFLLLSLMMEVVGWLEQIPFGHLFVQAPPIWLMAVYYVALLAWAGRRWWWPARKWVALACAPALLGGVFVTAKVDDVVAVTVLQVDEGAAIFVNLPGERADWLIDGGGQDGRRELVPFLRAQGVDRLAGLVVSCKDKAHVTGLHRVITEMPVKELILSDTSARSNPYWRWRGVAQSAGLATRHVRAGDAWSVRGVRFTVLSPPGDATAGRADDNALVLLLEYGATRLLLMSSAGASTEERLLQHNPDLRADIIIKGTHGKEPTGTAEFLAATRPQHVIQNVGAWSRHRPIDSALFERVENSGAKLWRTDQTGAVTVQLTARGYTIRSHR